MTEPHVALPRVECECATQHWRGQGRSGGGGATSCLSAGTGWLSGRETSGAKTRAISGRQGQSPELGRASALPSVVERSPDLGQFPP